MSIPERVSARIEKRGECQVWTGARNNKGYGSMRLSTHKTSLVHRFIYEQIVGPIPAGLTIDHLCRNKLCVNVEHLEVVTRSENSLRQWRDRAAEARAAKGITLPTEEELTAQRAEQFAVWDAAFGGLLSRHRNNTAA
jgi:hypothetical protein